jgi:hypothetical protein
MIWKRISPCIWGKCRKNFRDKLKEDKKLKKFKKWI